MPCLIGILVALAVAVYATALRLDRNRAFYAPVLIVVASYYVLFAVMGGGGRALIVELIIMSVFVAAATLGFRRSSWLIAAGLAGHGVMDFFLHAHLTSNPGMPVWWPAFCGAFDVAAGGFLAWRLTLPIPSGSLAPSHQESP